MESAMYCKSNCFEGVRFRHSRRILCAAVLAGAALFSSCEALAGSTAQTTRDSFVYVGTYPNGDSKGIYLYDFDEETGKLTWLGLAAEIANPSFVVTDPTHRYLYAVSDSDVDIHGPNANQAVNTISSFAIDAATGSLKFLNRVSSGGKDPIHLIVDNTGKILFAANYDSGSVASFSLRPDGSIGAMTGFDQHHGSSVNPQRQEGPHAHEVVVSPDNRFLFVPDLGLDRILIYRIDEAKRSFALNTPGYVAVKGGLGPRHFAFAPGGKFAYAICEMGSSVVAFSYDRESGALAPIQTVSTLPAGFSGEDNSAEMQIDKPGRFLYASNRGQNTITEFQIDQNTGKLTAVQNISTGGKTPRNFVIDPTGRYLLAANQDSNNIVLFEIDSATGRLTPAKRIGEIGAPVCLLFVPKAASQQPPSVRIANGSLELKVYLPDADHGFYRGTRFDWSGIIGDLTFAGHHLYGPWFSAVDPAIHDFTYKGPELAIVSGLANSATGPAEEFIGADGTALGFGSAQPGGNFVKIGIGVLRRPDAAPYDNFRVYEIVDHGVWQVHTQSSSVEFSQRLVDPATGYSYLYTKTLELIPGKPVLVIRHSLKNLGRLPIATDLYDHNFVNLDERTTGPDFKISFPFAPRFLKPVDGDLCRIEGNQILYNRPLAGRDEFYVPIGGFDSGTKNYEFRVENRDAGIGIHVTGDQPLAHVSMWSIRSVLAVEPYISFVIPPGQTESWSYKYTYYRL
jgi:6-phosphogluconolactonase